MPDTDVAARPGSTLARMRELFERVVELDPELRAAWLDLNVPDAEERTVIARLLAADQSEDGYLDVAAEEHAARMLVEHPLRPDGLIGQRFGAFRLTRLLGKGGMAAVFLGEREGADFQQRVAVKMLRRGLYSEVEQRLFRRERQLLASLDHPNIAHLVDGGVTGAGIPYLVIEYVDGRPITQHAAERRLGIHERLELFLIVCRAVEAAHRSLIVHRDIKPSNILVANGGVVKLLDFGIAKLLEDDGENATTGVCTPDYAAPEQLRGAPITTATDVYALGVLLHELLLGLRPQGNPTRRPSSLARMNGGEHVTLPKPALLPRALRGDLDTILLKCLDAEPARRYPSAGALADDIQRHLGGKPVEAHPPSRWYRTRKFVQRHRGSVAITAMFLLAIIATLALAFWQAKVARSEASRAREIQGFVESLFQPLSDGTAPDKAPSVQELLERGLARVDTSFKDDLRAQAELLDMFSRIQDQIGEIRNNRELSERAYRVTESLYGPNDVRTLDAREKHARVLYRLGEFNRALAELTTVREAMQANRIHGTSLAVVLEDIAFVRNAQGATDDELIALNQESLLERQADPQSTAENLGAGYNNLALAYVHANQLGHALELLEKAHDLFVQAKGESYVTATSLANIGGVMFRLGRPREGLPPQLEARAMFQRIGIDHHQMLVQILMGLCETETQLELHEHVAATCDEMVAMTTKVLGESHPRLVRALAIRASAEISLGRFDAAILDLDRARKIAPTIEGGGGPALRAIDLAAANMDRLRGDYMPLREHLLPSMIAVQTGGAAPAPNVLAWFALACDRAPGDGCGTDDAARARESLADQKYAAHPVRLAAMTALAQIDLRRGDARKSLEEVQDAIAVTLQELGEKHSWIGEAHLALGDARAALGDITAAAREYAAAAAILEDLPLDNRLRLEVANRRAAIHAKAVQ